MISNKKINQIVTELFISKLNISAAFIAQSYFAVPEDATLNYRHFLTMIISTKREL